MVQLTVQCTVVQYCTVLYSYGTVLIIHC